MRHLILGGIWPRVLFDAANEGAPGSEDKNNADDTASEGTIERYRPEGLEEAFQGETDQETIDKLMAGIQSAKPQLPADITGYEYTPADELKDYFAAEDDPLLNAAKTAALNNGIAPDAFSKFINETFKDPVAQGMIAPPYDPKREMDLLAGMIGGDAQAAEKAINDAEAIAGNIAQALKLPDHAAAFFSGMAETASGVMVIRAVQNMALEKGIPLSGSGDGNSNAFFSKSELRKMGDDQRLNPASGKYDEDLAKKYDDSYRHHYSD